MHQLTPRGALCLWPAHPPLCSVLNQEGSLVSASSPASSAEEDKVTCAIAANLWGNYKRQEDACGR